MRPIISICMVSFNCCEVIEKCLESLQTALQKIPSEIFVADNASKDKTVKIITKKYPAIHVLKNIKNLGFSVATNQGIQKSSGDFILLLNTDTILKSDTISSMLKFIKTDEKIGIVGPKVLNPDGSFQYQCRRGYPTPLAAFAYFSGLDKIFPNNKKLNQYLLRSEPINKKMDICSGSGCCLLVRKKMINQIGPLDEKIFAFGEDIDFCVRAKNAGWKVIYFPESEIIHLGGKGGAQSAPLTKIWAIHQAMKMFYEKHEKKKHNLVINQVIKIGIFCSFLFQTFKEIILGKTFKNKKKPKSKK